jgi:hypothetical protein
LQTEAFSETTSLLHKKKAVHPQHLVLSEESLNADKLHVPHRD